MKTKPTKKAIAKIKPFSKMSKAEKRIAIAKDVITQIEIGKLIPATEGYVNLPNDLVYSDLDIQNNYDKIKSCKVCALGACMMSATKFGNILKFKDVGRTLSSLENSNVKKLFSSIFSAKQLLLIESSFEGVNTSSSRFGLDVLNCSHLTDKEAQLCNDFYSQNQTDEKTLIAIMNNIIENKGTFKP